MVLSRILSGGWLLLAASGVPAAAQEVHPKEPARWFTDQVLAPRPDWYRPDLATRRVRQVTRTFHPKATQPFQPLGNRHQAAQPDQTAREVLTYDAQGHLVRYQYALLPLKPGAAAPVLGNLFTYDTQHRLRHIQVNGAKALLAVEDLLSSKAYARWRKPHPLFRQQHQLPAWHEFQEIFPDTWQLQSITCGYDANGRALLPRAVIALSAHTMSTQERRFSWVDTVSLDPQRDWHLATPDTLAGYADSAWLHHPDRWWQLRVATSSVPGLRVQQLPPNDTRLGRVSRPADFDYGQYYIAESHYGFTGFFGPTGQLQLARMPGAGTVWRYRYDAQGQPQSVDAYFMNLPQSYGDTLYFGQGHSVAPIPDCEKRQRQALALPDGTQAVRELLWIQEVQYEHNKQGLVTRAVVRTTTPHYAVNVSFNTMLSTVRAYGHDGPFRKVKNWRRVKKLLAQRRKFQARGCVPMKLTTDDTSVIEFGYEFF